MQPNQRGDYHDHDEMEQLYYFTEGAGQMQIDGEVRHGDGCASLLWAVGCVSLEALREWSSTVVRAGDRRA